jgi:hypothetical protein
LPVSQATIKIIYSLDAELEWSLIIQHTHPSLLLSP